MSNLGSSGPSHLVLGFIIVILGLLILIGDFGNIWAANFSCFSTLIRDIVLVRDLNKTWLET